jgi:hypothetical protein
MNRRFRYCRYDLGEIFVYIGIILAMLGIMTCCFIPFMRPRWTNMNIHNFQSNSFDIVVTNNRDTKGNTIMISGYMILSQDKVIISLTYLNATLLLPQQTTYLTITHNLNVSNELFFAFEFALIYSSLGYPMTFFTMNFPINYYWIGVIN